MLASHPHLPAHQSQLPMDLTAPTPPRHPAYRPSSSWSPQEDEALLVARARGLNWQPIADTYFPSKTANACRKRHERLIERQRSEDWSGKDLERLAQAYQEVRREMWSILARRLDEKWTVVEAKCMEKGIKNLSAAARSSNRRVSAHDGDDSGASVDGGIEWGPDMSFPSTTRTLPQEFQQHPGFRLTLPPPNVLQPQIMQSSGPSVPSMLSTQPYGYEHWAQRSQ